jgi:GlpG protein
MRLIGHLPNESSAVTFSDYLFGQGITNEVEAEKDGWAVWIHSEDELPRAKTLLTTFLGNQHDPQYVRKALKAREMRRQAAAEAEEGRSRVVDREVVFAKTLPYGVGALTLVLVGLSVILAVLAWVGYADRIREELWMTQTDQLGGYARGLPEIMHGEFWRLLTPVFVHFTPLHLLFNMLWLLDLGSMIEARQGTGRLGLLVVLFGIASNLAQYWWGGVGPNFNGMSGVVYGLLGYIWMKGKFDPASGLYLHPHTVAMMLIWFFLCLTPLVPGIANMAHAAGLALGIACGFLASLSAMRQR